MCRINGPKIYILLLFAMEKLYPEASGFYWEYFEDSKRIASYSLSYEQIQILQDPIFFCCPDLVSAAESLMYAYSDYQHIIYM